MTVIRRHLYDPNTDTHYLNGGYLAEDAEMPLPGGKWVAGLPPAGATIWEPVTPQMIQGQINDLVENIAPAVQLRYAGEMALISTYMDKNNMPQAVNLLLTLVGEMQSNNDTEGQQAVAPVINYLTQLNLLPE